MTTLYYESSNELYHHGVKGMKWGRRRYQNEDGSLTPAGVKRYATKGYTQDSYNSNKTKLGKAYDKYTGAHKISGRLQYDMASDKERAARAKQYNEEHNSPEAKAARKAKAVKAAKVGAAVAGTALAAYGAYKVNDYVKTANATIAADRGRKAADELFRKEQMRAFNDVKNGLSEVRSVEVNVNAYGKEAAERASRDSFGKAAKNVMKYQRSGGDVRSLSDLSTYDEDLWYKSKFVKR